MRQTAIQFFQSFCLSRILSSTGACSTLKERVSRPATTTTRTIQPSLAQNILRIPQSDDFHMFCQERFQGLIGSFVEPFFRPCSYHFKSIYLYSWLIRVPGVPTFFSSSTSTANSVSVVLAELCWDKTPAQSQALQALLDRKWEGVINHQLHVLSKKHPVKTQKDPMRFDHFAEFAWFAFFPRPFWVDTRETTLHHTPCLNIEPSASHISRKQGCPKYGSANPEHDPKHSKKSHPRLVVFKSISCVSIYVSIDCLYWLMALIRFQDFKDFMMSWNGGMLPRVFFVALKSASAWTHSSALRNLSISAKAVNRGVNHMISCHLEVRLSWSFQFMKDLHVCSPSDRREWRVLSAEVTAEFACVLLSCDMSWIAKNDAIAVLGAVYLHCFGKRW